MECPGYALRREKSRTEKIKWLKIVDFRLVWESTGFAVPTDNGGHGSLETRLVLARNRTRHADGVGFRRESTPDGGRRRNCTQWDR